jgi:hypothetical protein
MTIAICPEIRSAPRIVRPEALHAVGDRVPTWRRAIARSVIAGRHGSIIRARIIIWSGAIIVRRRQCTADHGPGDNCSGHRSTPSPTPTPAPPLHGLDRAWGRIPDRKPINSRAADAVPTHQVMLATNRVDAARVLNEVDIIAPFLGLSHMRHHSSNPFRPKWEWNSTPIFR